MNRIFVTGINTEVGKTVASAILCEALQAEYWKPVQCGELEFTDSDKLKNWVSFEGFYTHPERYRLLAPQSPHYAAELENIEITLNNFSIPNSDKNLIIEGAGGICVPLNKTDYFIDILDKNTPIILVSKHELGSINATLLSLEYLRNRGFNHIGILYNGDEKPSTEEVINRKKLGTEIGRIDHTESISKSFIKEQSEKLKKKLNEFLHIN